MSKVFFFQPRQGAVFIHIVEEIQHRRRKRVVLAPGAKPGHRLFIADIQSDRQFRMHALEQTNGHRIRNGVIHFAIDNRLHQRCRPALFIHAPAEIRVFISF